MFFFALLYHTYKNFELLKSRKVYFQCQSRTSICQSNNNPLFSDGSPWRHYRSFQDAAENVVTSQLRKMCDPVSSILATSPFLRCKFVMPYRSSQDMPWVSRYK